MSGPLFDDYVLGGPRPCVGERFPGRGEQLIHPGGVRGSDLPTSGKGDQCAAAHMPGFCFGIELGEKFIRNRNHDLRHCTSV